MNFHAPSAPKFKMVMSIAIATNAVLTNSIVRILTKASLMCLLLGASASNVIFAPSALYMQTPSSFSFL